MGRVTFTQVNSVVQANLQKNSSKVAALQEQLSSGRAINRPSDAPIDAANDIDLRSSLGSMDQWKRNNDDGSAYLAVIDSTLTQSANIFQKARQTAVQGSSDTLTALDRKYLLEDVHSSVMDQMLTLSNTNYKGDYAFSGYSIDTPPYSLESENPTTIAAKSITLNPVAMSTTTRNVGGTNYNYDVFQLEYLNDTTNAMTNLNRIIPGSLQFTPSTAKDSMDPTTGDFYVDYAKGQVYVRQTPTPGASPTITGLDWVKPTDKDITGEVKRQVDKGDLAGVKINVNANDVFGNPKDLTNEDTFQSVVRLMQGLYYSDSSEINKSITGIDAGLKRGMTSAAMIGAKTNQLELSGQRMDDRKIETQRLQSEIEDLDFAKAISDFTLAQSVLEASLSSAAKVLQPTLMNYL